jgi:APA family basic amino acid/polyamine antiporter
LTQNWHPFVPPNQGTFGIFGWSGVARGASVIFFAYIGFDAVSTAAQEAKNPQRDMPIGILGSLAICTVLYIVVAGLLTALVPYKRLMVAAPVALAMDSTGLSWGGTLVRLGTVLGLSTTMLVMLLGQSRIFYAMSRDGLLPVWAGAIHPTRRTPWISTIIVGIIVAFFGATISIGTLGFLVNIGTLLAFVIVSAGVWVLRSRRPELPRPFRAPWMPFTPIVSIVISLGLMAAVPWQTKMRLIVWLVIGLGVYFGYGRSHSKVSNPSRR